MIGFNKNSNKGFNSVGVNILSFAVAGIGLSISATAMQGITRNALASSYTLGTIASGILAMLLVNYFISPSHLSVNLLLNVLVSIMISSIFLILTFSPRVNSTRVIIIGLMINLFVSSITYVLKTKLGLNAEMINYFAGDSFIATWEKFYYAVPIILIFSFFLIFISKKINIYEFDPAKAHTLGIKKNSLRIQTSWATIVIASTSVFLVGPITFVGLLVPHLSRAILQNRKTTLWVMVLNIPISITVMVVSAIFARAFFNEGLTINIFLTALAGPLIIYKIIRSKNV